MSQEIINRRNIEAITVTLKHEQKRTEALLKEVSNLSQQFRQATDNLAQLRQDFNLLRASSSGSGPTA